MNKLHDTAAAAIAAHEEHRALAFQPCWDGMRN